MKIPLAAPGTPLGNAAVSAARNVSKIPHTAAETAAFPGWRSRAYLPHFDGVRVQQFITYHLADSLPRSALERMEAGLVDGPDDERAAERRRRLQGLLDAGIGSCLLRDPACASIVQNAFLHGDGERYRLLAWVVMPNHVHALIEPLEGWTLDRIVHSWKSFTAHAVLKTAAGTAAFPGGGHLWHREYWDRFIRDEEHGLATMRYIEANPVRASLAAAPEDWPWSHAYGRSRPSAHTEVPRAVAQAW